MSNDITATLQIKRDIYYVVLNLKQPNGQRKAKWISTKLHVKNNKRAAEQIMRDIVAEYNERNLVYDSNMRFDDLLSAWLENIHGKVRDSTYKNYEIVVNAHIIPYFKQLNIKARDLRPYQLEEYYKKMLETLSPVTVQKHHANIYSALEFACKNHILNSNVAKDVDMNWGKRKKMNVNVYSKEQISILLNVVKGDVIEVPITLIAQYGMRRSEALGLKWNAIDFENKTIAIKATLIYVGTELKWAEETKSETSNRVLPLTDEMADYLLVVKREQDRMKSVYGTVYHDGGFVCTRDNGDPISPNTLTKRFHLLLERKGMPMIRLHDLRHSAATNLLAANFPISDVCSWLGHADISTTVNIYNHFLETQKVACAKALSVFG